MMQHSTTILGGLPVTAHLTPSDDGLDLYQISFNSGHFIPDSMWKRAEQAGDLDRIVLEAIADEQERYNDYKMQMRRDEP